MSLTARPLRLATTDAGFDAALQARLHWSADTDAGIEQAVAGILADVRKRGDGAVVRRGFRNKPANFHVDRLRQKPAGYFFDVITNGFGAMQDYSAQIAVEDRWAIVAYVRALQLSQNATLEDVPTDQRAQLTSGAPAASAETPEAATP